MIIYTVVDMQTHCQANLYGIGRNDRFFPNAERYQPERWLRGENAESRSKTQASLTFGHGPRMCIGRWTFINLRISKAYFHA